MSNMILYIIPMYSAVVFQGHVYKSFIKDGRSRRRHLTDKFDDWVGHLNTILVRGGQEFERSNLQRFKCPGFAGGGGGQVSS